MFNGLRRANSCISNICPLFVDHWSDLNRSRLTLIKNPIKISEYPIKHLTKYEPDADPSHIRRISGIYRYGLHSLCLSPDNGYDLSTSNVLKANGDLIFYLTTVIRYILKTKSL